MIEPVTAKRRAPALGRGLSALLGDSEVERGPSNDGVREIAIADISADPDQPRRFFDSEALDELAASIASRGVLQPIVVRPVGGRPSAHSSTKSRQSFANLTTGSRLKLR
jgi:ParB family transcriptional regulator, chromosome partitioning protein